MLENGIYSPDIEELLSHKLWQVATCGRPNCQSSSNSSFVAKPKEQLRKVIEL